MFYTFHKSERLCSKKLIAQLFTKGNRGFTRFPFRFSWVATPLDAPTPVQVLFVVSKRNFPNATDRNKIKRHLRELYRLNKQQLYDAIQDKQIALAIMYIAPSHLTFAEMQTLFNTALKQLIKDVAK